jgi:hypothetical protein
MITVRVSHSLKMEQAVNCTCKEFVLRVLMELEHKTFMQDQISRNSQELPMHSVLINTLFMNGQSKPMNVKSLQPKVIVSNKVYTMMY